LTYLLEAMSMTVLMRVCCWNNEMTAATAVAETSLVKPPPTPRQETNINFVWNKNKRLSHYCSTVQYLLLLLLRENEPAGLKA
jgi:hypothetical protein